MGLIGRGAIRLYRVAVGLVGRGAIRLYRVALGDRARGCSWCDIQNTQSVTKRLCSKRIAVYLQAVSGWHKHSCFSGSDERLGPHLWQPVPSMMASVRLLGCNQQRV